MSADAVGTIIGTIIGAVIGVVGTAVGALVLARREERNRAKASCLHIATLARPVATRLLETMKHRAMPIEGYAPTLNRFSSGAMSTAVLSLDANQQRALHDALTTAELAIRHIDRRWKDLQGEDGRRILSGYEDPIYEEMSAAAEDALNKFEALLKSLGDDLPVKDRLANSKGAQGI